LNTAVVDTYDHATKAGNQGDVIKHPTLVAALRGLVAEHHGVFRYADTFAGRWDSDLSWSRSWRQGIGAFANRWNGGNPDIDLWRSQWAPMSSGRYPGSTRLATELLAAHGSYEIRAFEIVQEYAADLRDHLGSNAVLTRPATARDWDVWMPDLLFIDPPGLHAENIPTYPSPSELLQTALGVKNVLIWLPMMTDLTRGDPVLPLNATTRAAWAECLKYGYQVIAARWQDGGPMSGCLLACRFESSRVSQRVGRAVHDVAQTMGRAWRIM
jgi:23S rRNA A2030 N6-methylase RlmJ